MLSISKGNLKLGQVANINLLPGASCRDDAPCRAGCYAEKCIQQYARSAGQIWGRNLEKWRTDPKDFWRQLSTFLDSYSGRFFRFHAAGDIQDQAYLNWMMKVAKENKGIRFLAYTKKHELDFRRRPDNLNIVLSMWPGWGKVGKRMPYAWMQDGSETRIPEDAQVCPGGCAECGYYCWQEIAPEWNIVFNKH